MLYKLLGCDNRTLGHFPLGDIHEAPLFFIQIAHKRAVYMFIIHKLIVKYYSSHDVAPLSSPFDCCYTSSVSTGAYSMLRYQMLLEQPALLTTCSN